MAKEKKVEPVVASPQVVAKRCPLDGTKLVHMEVDGLMGWACVVEDCGYFMPDPI